MRDTASRAVDARSMAMRVSSSTERSAQGPSADPQGSLSRPPSAVQSTHEHVDSPMPTCFSLSAP